MKRRPTPRRLYAWDLAHELFSSRGSAPLVVCADPENCETMKIDPSISLQEFTSRLETIPKDREIVFYSKLASDSAAAERAREYLEKGFSGTASLEGGFEAWITIANFLPGKR